MSSTSRRRPVLAAAAIVAALAVTATACGPSGDGADADAAPSASAKEAGTDELGLPRDLPTSLEELDKWRGGEWKKWDRDDWLREAADFINPIIEDLWDPERMQAAEENDRQVDESDIDEGAPDQNQGGDEDEGVTDPAPRRVRAEPVRTPYTDNAAPVGKVFMDTPKGAMVCSGTVVKDPRNPGRSNLVATAGHCVHAGKSGGWYRNIVFVPSYNNKALPLAELDKAPREDVAPHGVYWADWAQTTAHWIAKGSDRGGKGAGQDFSVLRVKPEAKGGTSLEEAVGTALPVDFGTPEVASVGSLTAHGYPATPPFDGLTMHTCSDKPGRLTVAPSEPTMYRIGCTMTGGSSGGGWFTDGPDGKPRLVSVTSIGPLDHSWLAGPRLGMKEKGVYDAVSRKAPAKG